MTRIVCSVKFVAATQASSGDRSNGINAVTDADHFAKTLYEGMASGGPKKGGGPPRFGANAPPENSSASLSGDVMRDQSDAQAGLVSDVLLDEEHLQESTSALNKSRSENEVCGTELTAVGILSEAMPLLQSGLTGPVSQQESRERLVASTLAQGELNRLGTAPESIAGAGQHRFSSEVDLFACLKDKGRDVVKLTFMDGVRHGNRIVTAEKDSPIVVKGIETHLAFEGARLGERGYGRDAPAALPSKMPGRGGSAESHDGLLREDNRKEPKAGVSLSKVESNKEIRGAEPILPGLIEQPALHGLLEGDVIDAAGSDDLQTSRLIRSGVPSSGVMKSLTLHLTPDVLGPVVLAVSRSENSVSVRLTVQDDTAVAALSREREELIELLDGVGLQLDQMQVIRGTSSEKDLEPGFPQSSLSASSGTLGTGAGDRSSRGFDNASAHSANHSDDHQQDTKNAVVNSGQPPAMSNQSAISLRRVIVL